MYPKAHRYILDSNGRGDFDRWTGRIETDIAPAPMRRGLFSRGKGSQQVWSPGVDDMKQYDIWLEGIRKTKESAIVLIDELSAITKVGQSARGFPPNFARLLKQGRVVDLEHDEHICVIICTQEQAYMPRQVLNQATHVLRFRLQSEYDARAIERGVGMRTSIPQPSTKHGFFYVRADDPSRYFEYDSPIQFLGKAA